MQKPADAQASWKCSACVRGIATHANFLMLYAANNMNLIVI